MKKEAVSKQNTLLEGGAHSSLYTVFAPVCTPQPYWGDSSHHYWRCVCNTSSENNTVGEGINISFHYKDCISSTLAICRNHVFHSQWPIHSSIQAGHVPLSIIFIQFRCIHFIWSPTYCVSNSNHFNFNTNTSGLNMARIRDSLPKGQVTHLPKGTTPLSLHTLTSHGTQKAVCISILIELHSIQLLTPYIPTILSPFGKVVQTQTSAYAHLQHVLIAIDMHTQ